MKTGIKVCDAMTEKPVTVSSKTALQECAKLMNEQHVGSLLVKDKGEVIGIITEQDIVRKAVASAKPATTTVATIMEENLIQISPEKDIFEALRVMRDYNIRHLPVADGNNFLGLITLKDILKIEPDLFDLLVEKFEIKEEERKPVYTQPEKEGVCELCGKYSPELKYEDGSMVCPDCK